MQAAGVVLLVLAALAASGPVPVGTTGPAPARPSLHEWLPLDPLLALALSTEDLAGKIGGAANWLGGGEPAPDGPSPGRALAALEERTGQPLERLLGAYLGPRVALSVDPPPLDFTAAALQEADGEALAILLGRSGVLATVRDAEGLAASLRALFDSLSAEVREDGDGVVARIPLEAGGALGVFYAIRDERLALGFSREWVRECLSDRPVAERLPGGADFAAVFAQLDADPASLTYVNLPKLRGLLADSRIVQALLRGNPQVEPWLQPLLSTEVMSRGVGSTSVAVGGGVRTTSFGPPWMSGTAVSGGLLAVLSVPGLFSLAEGHDGRRTLRDIESIATACEGFSGDARGYPGPTDGWVPVEDVATFLEPIYIASLPRVDAWDNPILYWSDGQHYRVISTGRDGRMDRDWSTVSEPTSSTADDGDIVFGDGRLLVVPARLLE